MSNKHNGFSLFSEKLLPEDVKLVSWCPTADLILIISPDSSMSLYRNGTTRLWVIENKIKSAINVVSWKPNGKEFVIGCDNGQIYKVDISYHSPQISEYCIDSNNSTDFSPITGLVWINYEFKKKHIDLEGFDIDAFNLEASLPTLSEEPPVEPISRFPIPKKKKAVLPPKPIENKEVQTLLFAGNKKGQIQIFLNGIYPIGLVDIKDTNINVSIVNVTVSENASSIQILAKSEEVEDEYILYFLDTQVLEDKKEEIFSISEIQTQLNYLLQYNTVVMNILEKHHASYTRATRNIVTEASDYIMKHKEQAAAMPEIEILGTLATGNVTAPLQALFVDYLTTQCIKQWETNANHGYKSSQRILCEYVFPACERIQLSLSKLLGFSLWTQRYGDFLEVEAVKKCIDSTQVLLVELHSFSKALGSLINLFAAFVSWITLVSQMIYDPNPTEPVLMLCEDPDLVAKYLYSDFTKDSLASYFESPSDKNASNKNIIQLLSNLTQLCSQMLEKPSKTISSKVHVKTVYPFKLNGVSLHSKSKRNIVHFTRKVDNEESVIYAISKSNPNQQLLLIKIKFGEPPLQYALFDIQGEISDLEFFDQNELGIMVEINKNNSQLQTIPLEGLEFKDFVDQDLVSYKVEVDFKALKIFLLRTQELRNMIGVKIGCNGLPRRRILSAVASNGLMKVYSMDEEEEDEDSDSSNQN